MANILVWAAHVMETSSDAIMVLLSAVGALSVLILSILSFIALQHFRQDEVRHNNRKAEMDDLQEKHKQTVERIFIKLAEYDRNTTELRVDVVDRLARMETRLDSLIGGQKA